MSETAPCPMCGQPVPAAEWDCPHCGEPIHSLVSPAVDEAGRNVPILMRLLLWTHVIVAITTRPLVVLNDYSGTPVMNLAMNLFALTVFVFPLLVCFGVLFLTPRQARNSILAEFVILAGHFIALLPVVQ